MKPYLIVTHDYKQQSAGVRALHKLAHYLNMAGCEAWVTSEIRNPEWITPLASPDAQAEIAKQGIVVYPEVEAGNKLNARQVVRFVLNVPGRIRGDRTFPVSEQLFCYSGLLRDYVHNPINTLTVPVIDQSIFNAVDTQRRHDHTLFWAGRGDRPKEKAWVEIRPHWPSTQQGLARLFKQYGWLISCTPYTMLIHEARLCGCAVVVVPNEYWTWAQYRRAAPGVNGLAWGFDEIELQRAKATVARFRYDYAEMVAGFAVQLDRFIDKTQRWQG